MKIDREMRDFLNQASLRAFGTSSKWKKLMDQGEYFEGMTMDKNGKPTRTVKAIRPTLEQVVEVMDEIIKKKFPDEYKEEEDGPSNTVQEETKDNDCE